MYVVPSWKGYPQLPPVGGVAISMLLVTSPFHTVLTVKPTFVWSHGDTDDASGSKVCSTDRTLPANTASNAASSSCGVPEAAHEHA